MKAGELLLWVQCGRINHYLAYMLLLLVGAIVLPELRVRNCR